MDGCVRKSKRQGEKIGKRNEGRKEKFFMFMRVIDEHPCSNFTYANVKPQRNCACILLSDISREIEKSSIFEQLKISFFFFLFFDIITLPTQPSIKYGCNFTWNYKTFFYVLVSFAKNASDERIILTKFRKWKFCFSRKILHSIFSIF